jgi:alkylated DNA repair protein alkB family protein 8
MDEESNAPPPAFVKPSRALQEPTAHLYVANCGPAVGISFSEIKEAFQGFGPVLRVQPAGDSGSRVYVSYANESDAVAAREAWNSKPCDALRSRVMVIQHAVPQSQPAVSSGSCVEVLKSLFSELLNF